MANFIKSNKELISKCYLVILAVSALVFQAVVYRCTYDFNGDEWILFWKMTPWSLVPMIICALLAAYFTDKGYGKTVGITGLFLLLGSAVVLSGSMLWASSYRDEVLTTSLCGYNIRLSLAVFLIAVSFMRGGAIAILLSLLSNVRYQCVLKSGELQWMCVSAIIILILALLMLIVRFQLTRPVIALGGSILVVMTIPAFLCIKSIADAKPDTGMLPICAAKKTGKEWIMPTTALLLCILTIVSYWQYIPNSWRYYHIGARTIHYMAMIISLVTFAVCLWIPKKLARKKGILIGAILLLLGLPLGAMMMDEGVLFDIIPMILIGMGVAMIIRSTMESFVMMPVKMYTLSWVGIVSGIIVISKLMFIVFNRIEAVLHTRSVAAYIVYPLMAFALMVLGWLIMERNKDADEL